MQTHHCLTFFFSCDARKKKSSTVFSLTSYSANFHSANNSFCQTKLKIIFIFFALCMKVTHEAKAVKPLKMGPQSTWPDHSEAIKTKINKQNYEGERGVSFLGMSIPHPCANFTSTATIYTTRHPLKN